MMRQLNRLYGIYLYLQAKVIKTAAFCHNRALQDLYPDSVVNFKWYLNNTNNQIQTMHQHYFHRHLQRSAYLDDLD